LLWLCERNNQARNKESHILKNFVMYTFMLLTLTVFLVLQHLRKPQNYLRTGARMDFRPFFVSFLLSIFMLFSKLHCAPDILCLLMKLSLIFYHCDLLQKYVVVFAMVIASWSMSYHFFEKTLSLCLFLECWITTWIGFF